MAQSSGSRSQEASDKGGRPVPHDLDAEAAVLGAMLLSPEAVREGVTRIDSSMFYGPAHGHVFEAISRLHEAGIAVDPITVADELRAMGGLLEEVGGPGFLVDLESTTPATSNVAHHAAIVERAYRQRQMMGYAFEIAEQARAGTDWHAGLGALLELGQRNGVVHSSSSIEFVELGPIVAGDADEERPFWLRRGDGNALLYPGRVHDLHAAPGVGKTWVALALIREALEAGGSALFIDYEDTARNAVGRLRAMGTSPELLADPTRFRYSNPAGPFGLAERAHLDKVLIELEPDVVILDSVGEALARSGYDENSNTDVTTFGQETIRPLAASGAAVFLLDHVTKSSEHRARGARGAGAKLGLVTGASFELLVSRSFSRTRPGFLRIKIAKDRVGHVGAIGEIVADVTVTPDGDGGLALDVDAPSQESHKLTGLMEALSHRLENQPGPVTAGTLFAGFSTERRHLERALADLVADDHVETIENGGTVTYRSALAYREPGKEANGRTETGPADPTTADPASGPEATQAELYHPSEGRF